MKNLLAVALFFILCDLSAQNVPPEEKTPDTILSLVNSHISNGSHGKASQASSEYTKETEVKNGVASLEYADSLLVSAVFKNEVGFYDEAIASAEKALAIYRCKNGESAPENLIPLSMLFSLYDGSCANYDKALKTLDEIISIAKTNSGFSLQTRRLSEIRPYFREMILFAISHKKEDRVHDIAEALAGSPHTEESIYSLIMLDCECKRFEMKTPENATEKIRQYNNNLGEKLREARQKHGLNSLESYACLIDFYKFNMASENSTAALKNLEEAYEIKKSILGENSPELLPDIENLLMSYTDPEDKTKCIASAREIIKKRLVPDIPTDVRWINLEAMEANESDREKLLIHALETTRKHYGEDSPATADSLAQLLFYYLNREIPSVSEQILMSLERSADKLPWNSTLVKALNSLERSMPPPRFETEKFNDTLAEIIALCKKNFREDNVQQIPLLIESIKFKEKVGSSPDKLKDIVSEIIRIRKKAEGKDNPFIALYYLKLKDELEYSDAVRDNLESALSEGLEISEKNFGGKDLLTAQCLVELSYLYLMSNHNLNKAEEYLTRALSLYEKLDFLTVEHEICLKELMELHRRNPENHAKYENTLKELRKKYKWENE